MPMNQPVHPGRIVRHDCLEPLGLSVNDAADALGVSRYTVSRVINERSGISPEMAIRLSKAFGNSPGFWLRLQLDYDLARIEEQAKNIDIPRYTPPELLPKAT